MQLGGHRSPLVWLLLGLLVSVAFVSLLSSAAKDKSGGSAVDRLERGPKGASSSSNSKQQQSTNSQSSSKKSKTSVASNDHQSESQPEANSASKKSPDKRVADWLRKQKQANQDVIELVDEDMLNLLIGNMKHLVVLFYDASECTGSSKSANKCKKILQELENIDDETDDEGIQFVKCEDLKSAKEIGISSLPALVYFEQSSAAPSIYQGDLEQEELVLEWLVKQKNEDTIENINRDILQTMLTGKQANRRTYIACLFYKQSHEASEQVLEQLENIDDDLHEYEIHLVKLADDLIAKKYGVRHPPGLVLFRNGEPLKYPGELNDVDSLVSWLTRPENLETKDSIESVNEKMFHRFLKHTDHLAVLFYSENANCKQCPRILEELETIDDELADLEIRFIKVDSQTLARKYGVHALPSLIYLTRDEDNEQHKATIFAGDLKKGNEILEWLTEQKSPHLNQIQELTGRQCRELVKTKDHLAIYLYSDDDDSKADTKSGQADPVDDNDDDDQDDDYDGDSGVDADDDDDDDDDDEDDEDDVLAGLENIDSECRRQSIEFVKTKDKSFIKEFGLEQSDLPAFIYFEKGIPSIYEGDLSAEEDLLDWLLRQQREDTIEEVNRRLLERLIESSHYLVVLFYKNQCKSCQSVLETLERIDDDCDTYGIAMVKINDMTLARRYGIKTFPALIYFRNGNPLIYAGDLKNESEVLDWLLEDEQRELIDEIEDINGRMLDKLVDSSPFLAALFYDDDCTICPKVLNELEKIDDDTDLYGIDFVKINDFQAARKYNVHTFPTLVYFRKQTPSYYDGDLLDEDRVLNWLTSNDVFELEDEIEEVNKKMLDKLLATSDYIAVYFYEKNCKHCEDVLKELEHIDDEADSLDIMFVKIRDMNYAKKFGITQAPSLVYFRKKFPSIYRGDLMREEKVLEWLRKNRYRNPELNLFMYALFAITISFIIYTIFLMFCVKKKQD